LSKEPIAALYLFHGDEAYLIDRAVDHVRRRLPQDAVVQTFYAGQDSVEAVLDGWGAPSLFASQTLAILRSAEQLRDAERERLAQEAEFRDASQPLVVCAHGRLELTRKFFSRCAKTGFAAEFRRPFANQLPGWAQRLARERRLRLSDEAAQLLADLIGPDLLALSTELDKVATFVFPDTDIDAQAVAMCTGDVHQHGAFELADALGLRDRKKALGLLRQVLTDERRAVPVLHALVGHFRRLWQLRDAQDQGLPEAHIERTLGLRGQRLRRLLNQSRLYSVPDLRRVLHRAAALDRRLKSARTPAGVLFDALVLDICARPR
jgi:DNA polymerase-3 subunit delta